MNATLIPEEKAGPSTCRKCQRVLRRDTPWGLCPRCLAVKTAEGGVLEAVFAKTPVLVNLPRAFGSYELLEEVARGGMGIVYKARQAQVKRIVALKVLAGGQFASPDFLERFRTEAEAVARLDHANIVPIHEVSECDGQPFFSMKFVAGGSLAARIGNRRAPISNRHAAELLAKLARAVHYAHQRGILHRDIKPGNVLLDAENDEPYLTDFGLAKLVENESNLTQTMAMLGTPSYMSPEQARGEAKQLTTAVDVYGLGAVFYELLTGQPPFVGGTPMETMRQVLEKEPRRLSALKLGIDRDLETICLKCLEKDPRLRYGSAEGLAADLEHWLRHEPIRARHIRGWEQAAKWVRRRPLTAALSAITLFAVAASVVTLIRANIRIRTAQANEARMLQIAQGQERVARQRAYASDINLAQRALTENNLGRARELLIRHRPGNSGETDLRGWEWRYLWQQCRSDALYRLTRDEGSVDALVASADGRWLAVGGGGGGGGRLGLWDFTTRREVKRLVEGVTSLRAAFSPATNSPALLAYAFTLASSPTETVHRLRLWNTTTNTAEWLLPGKCAGLAFSSDGQTVLAAINEPSAQFVRWNVADQAAITLKSKVATAPIRKTIGTPFAASRDLRWVATALLNDRIRVTDLESGQVAWESGVGGPINSVAIDPTGKILAAGIQQTDPVIQLYDLRTGQELGRLPVRAGYIIHMLFGPDGRTVLAAGSDQTITHWDVSGPEQFSPVATLRGHSLEVWRLALLGDGRTLVSGSADGEVLVWNLENARSHDFRVTLPVAPRSCWRFAPGSDAILTCQLDGEVTRWTGREFQERQTLLNLGEGLVSAGFSEDCSAIGASFMNGMIRVWDLRELSLRREFKVESSAMVIWGFAENLNRLLGVNERNQSLHEWDLRTGVEQKPVSDFGDLSHWQIPGAFPGEARHRSAGEAASVRLRSHRSPGEPQRLSEAVIRLFAGAFSPDGRYFARTALMGTVELEDGSTGQLLGRLRGFLQGVHSVAFSPDSRRLAAGSDDREAVRLWDLQSFQELVTLRGESTAFSQTRFSPDGDLLGTMNYKGVLHVWRAPSWPEIEAAERERRNEEERSNE